MRSGPAETRGLIAAVDRIAFIEENRIRHRRPIVFARKPLALESLRPIAAVRCVVTPAPRRHRPAITIGSVNLNAQALRRFIDCDHDTGPGICDGKQKNKADEHEYDTRQSLPPGVSHHRWHNLINLDKNARDMEHTFGSSRNLT